MLFESRTSSQKTTSTTLSGSMAGPNSTGRNEDYNYFKAHKVKGRRRAAKGCDLRGEKIDQNYCDNDNRTVRNYLFQQQQQKQTIQHTKLITSNADHHNYSNHHHHNHQTAASKSQLSSPNSNPSSWLRTLPSPLSSQVQRVARHRNWQPLLALLLLLDILVAPIGSFVIQISESPQDANHHHHLRAGGNHSRNIRVLFKRASVDGGDQAGSDSSGDRLQLRPGAVRSAKLQEVDALVYLQRYGYMNGTLGNANLISEDSFHEAVMSFQRFAGIPETGLVDGTTVRYMQMPRCGNKDRANKGPEEGKRRRKRRRRRRRKRYALQGSKWRRQELTYRISQYPTRFLHKKHEVDGQIERAFSIWSRVAPIDFVVKREGRVHIDIKFASGEHGDGDPFDGPGNTLAHAYFPQYGGDAHFDDQEYWTVDSYSGTNIFQVAAHELGHSLGLGHSSVREALMAPFYQKYKPNFKLHPDDVLAIQALYGNKDNSNDADDQPPVGSTSTSTTTTTTTTTESTPRRRLPTPASDDDDNGGGGLFNFGGGGGKAVDLCQDSSIDAVTRTEDGSTYVFRGQYYWLIKNEGIASGYPARISRDWDGLPGNLDAALTWSDGKTFFFKGDKYWRFFNKRREPGYPKLISAGFAGIPNNLDAAFVWSGNGKTYFFKRDKYWRFDSKQEPPVSSQYPKSIKNWSGLPANGIDGAFKWDNGMTYFFKDDVYYRFDDREFEVDTSARPAFPRSTAEWWFGCTNSNLPIRRKSGGNSERGEEPNEGEEGAAGNSANGDNDSSDSSTSTLLFHRKPNLLYEQQPATSRSISRSIISSLSALFPSSSSSSSSSPDSLLSSSKQADDWSFHRGLGEEVRRRSARRDSSTSSASVESQPRLRSDSTRWSFPLATFDRHHNHQTVASGGGGGSSSREQSLSELRMAPSSSSSSTATATAAPPPEAAANQTS